MAWWKNTFSSLFVALALVCATKPAFGEATFTRVLDKVDAGYYEKTLRILAGDKPVPIGLINKTLTDRNTPANLKLARAYMMDQVKEMGFDTLTKQEFELPSYAESSYELRGDFFGRKRPAPKGVNYWFEIPGSERPSEVITVGAHYDTIFEGVPGANDNGTGVTAVLTIAKAFKDSGLVPKRTIRFLLFDKEEPPFSRDGSEAFFEKRLLVDGEKNVLFLNIDMIGHSPLGTMHAGYSGEMFPAGEKLLKKAAEKAGFPQLELTSFEPFISDNLPATFRGVPSLSICEDARDKHGGFVEDPNNHSPFDKVSEINFAYAHRLTRWAASAALIAAHNKDEYGTPASNQIAEMARSAAKLKATGAHRLASDITRALEHHCMDEMRKLAGDSYY